MLLEVDFFMQSSELIQLYANECFHRKADITWIAIGSNYTKEGGMQQFPPFLQRLKEKNPSLIFEVIIIDPLIQQQVKIAEYLNVRKIDDNEYHGKNISVYCIREYFCYEYDNPGFIDSKSSKTFIENYVARTVRNKLNNPDRTNLLFVRGFTCTPDKPLSDEMLKHYETLDSQTLDAYKKSVKIGLGPDGDCYPDLDDLSFYPRLVVNNKGALELVNMDSMSTKELMSIYSIRYDDNTIYSEIMKILDTRLNDFKDSYLTSYRRFRVNIDDPSKQFEDILSVIPNGKERRMFGDIVTKSICKNTSSRDLYVKNVTDNLFEILKTDLFSFLDDFEKQFEDFINICQVKTMDNGKEPYYEYINVFSLCVFKIIDACRTNSKDYDANEHSGSSTISKLINSFKY